MSWLSNMRTGGGYTDKNMAFVYDEDSMKKILIVK